MGVGWPAHAKLQEFGSQVWAAFGDCPYHVGSSLTSKRGWFDVDVRLILEDEKYAALELGDPRFPQQSGKWVSLCWAYSELGRVMTGLPIDFQIQQQTRANQDFGKECLRSALGLVPLRWEPETTKTPGP